MSHDTHSSSNTNQFKPTNLPISLWSQCCIFLNLKELHATHSVSHTFHAASLSEATWKENSKLPSFHHSTFPSPRTQLRSATPLVELAAIRSSPHGQSFGRSARWMEVCGSVHEFGDIRQMIEHESRNLDGLIIRTGLTSRSLTRIEDSSSSNETESIKPNTLSPSIPMSSLRVLFMGKVDELLMAALLPIIPSMHSLEILELELYAAKVCPAVFSLTNGFAVSLGQLKSLHTLILSDPAYRCIANGERSLMDSKILVLSASSVEELIQLEGCAPRLKRIELCMLLGCCTKCYESGCLPSAAIVTVTTLAITAIDFTPSTMTKLFSFFPNLSSLIDCSSESNWTLFMLLPPTVVELTVSHLYFFFNLDQLQSLATSSPNGQLRRLKIHHFTCYVYNADLKLEDPYLRATLPQVTEFYYHSLSSDGNVPLYSYMPHLKIGTSPWLSQYEDIFKWSETQELLAQLFPLANKLHFTLVDGKFRSAYEARGLLRAIPNLKEVKWNNEPWLSLDRIESYYSWPNIDQRLKQRLNLDQLDHIQPILQQLNTSQLPNSVNLNLLSLTLIFQFLTPMDLFSAHRVCRSYRVAAVSPLVLRPNIRVRIDDDKGVIVSGTQVSFTSIKPMLSAVRSMLFQNIRILSLPPPLESAIQSLPRQPDFYHYHLDRFELIPFFHSLHTLALDWSTTSIDSPTPTDADHGLIDRVFQSASLKHLKVLRLRMSSPLVILILTACLSHLKELEVVQLYGTQRGSNQNISFNQLGKLKTLKQVFIEHDHGNTTHNNLTELLEMIRTSDSIESIYWCPLIGDDLIHARFEMFVSDAPSPPLTRVKSITAEPVLHRGLSRLDTLVRVFPDLDTLNLMIGFLVGIALPPIVPFPIPFCHQLRTLNISCPDDASMVTLLEMLYQSSLSALVWSRLERFSLIGSGRYDAPPNYLSQMTQTPSRLITATLDSMTHLKELIIENVQLLLNIDDPQPLWIGRLHQFQHSDLTQLIRLLPLANQLIQLRTDLEFCYSSIHPLIPLLLAHSQFQDVYFYDRHVTRTELIRIQADAEKKLPDRVLPPTTIIRINRKQRPTPATSYSSTSLDHTLPPTSTPSTIPSSSAAAADHAAATRVRQELKLSYLRAELASADVSLREQVVARIRTLEAKLASSSPGTDGAPTSLSTHPPMMTTDSTTSPHHLLEEQLEEMFMQLVESFRNNN